MHQAPRHIGFICAPGKGAMKTYFLLGRRGVAAPGMDVSTMSKVPSLPPLLITIDPLHHRHQSKRKQNEMPGIFSSVVAFTASTVVSVDGNTDRNQSPTEEPPNATTTPTSAAVTSTKQTTSRSRSPPSRTCIVS